MKRLAFSVMSVCVVCFASGCCWWPGMMPMWGGGGCPNGACPPNPYGLQTPQGALPPATHPYGLQTPQGALPPANMMQTNYAPIATTPIYAQPTTIAFPQPIAPTMAVESLPTYR